MICFTSQHTHTYVWENVTLTQTHELKHNYAYNTGIMVNT